MLSCDDDVAYFFCVLSVDLLPEELSFTCVLVGHLHFLAFSLPISLARTLLYLAGLFLYAVMHLS